jgi:P4 family phage/plasmid primase-like protien
MRLGVGAKEYLYTEVDATHKFLYTAGTLYELVPNGIYVKAEDHQVESYLTSLSLREFGMDLLKRSEKANFVDYIKSKYFVRWEEVQSKQNRNLIPFKNLVFNVADFKKENIENMAAHYFFFQIPHNLNEGMLIESLDKNYTPEVALKIFAPKIYQFFSDIVGEDKVMLQLAKIGYTFYPSNPFKLMFMELGPKDAGKTTFLKLFTYIIGERNISNISLQDLADYRFARAELWGKLANIYDDLPITAIKNQGIIKMISGESRIDAPVKMKQEIQSFVNTAKSIYTTNRLPYVYDSTDEAFFSRWIITNYPNHFQRNDGFYSNLISNESEIEGLIVASLLALRDLLARRFSFEDKTKENMELWQKQNNNIYAFISDSIQADAFELDKDLKIEKDELYNAYVSYCNDMEIDAVTKTKFTQELQRLFNISTTKIQKDGKMVWGYAGIGVKKSVQAKISPQATINAAQQENAEKTQLNAKEWQAILEAKVAYEDPIKKVICPHCVKAVSKLYEYDGQWFCVDCLNEVQHQNDDVYV